MPPKKTSAEINTQGKLMKQITTIPTMGLINNFSFRMPLQSDKKFACNGPGQFLGKFTAFLLVQRLPELKVIHVKVDI